MPSICAARLTRDDAPLTADAIRTAAASFANFIASRGVKAVRVWCSYNPNLPDDSPLQSPEQTVEPQDVIPFLDTAVRNEVWTYGDDWNRAGVKAIDGAFELLLSNDKDVILEAQDQGLLDAMRQLWRREGFEVFG